MDSVLGYTSADQVSGDDCPWGDGETLIRVIVAKVLHMTRMSKEHFILQ